MQPKNAADRAFKILMIQLPWSLSGVNGGWKTSRPSLSAAIVLHGPCCLWPASSKLRRADFFLVIYAVVAFVVMDDHLVLLCHNDHPCSYVTRLEEKFTFLISENQSRLKPLFKSWFVQLC